MEKQLGARIIQSIPMDAIPSKVRSSVGESLVVPFMRSQAKERDLDPASQNNPTTDPSETFPDYPNLNKSGSC